MNKGEGVIHIPNLNPYSTLKTSASAQRKLTKPSIELLLFGCGVLLIGAATGLLVVALGAVLTKAGALSFTVQLASKDLLLLLPLLFYLILSFAHDRQGWNLLGVVAALGSLMGVFSLLRMALTGIPFLWLWLPLLGCGLALACWRWWPHKGMNRLF